MGSQYDDDDDDFEGDDTPLVKRLRAQLKEKDREIGQLSRQIEEHAADSHERSIREILTDWSLPPNIARYVPDDVTNEDELNDWLDEFGADFGIGPAEDSYDDDPDAQANERMADVEFDGYDPYVGEDLEAQLEGANSVEEVLRIARSQR